MIAVIQALWAMADRFYRPDCPIDVPLPTRNRFVQTEEHQRHSRIRQVFGLPLGAPLPRPSPESLAQYHRYLSARLVFPFSAAHVDDYEGATCDHLITATRLLAPTASSYSDSPGLNCEVLAGHYPVTVRLAELRPCTPLATRQLLDDYRHWLRNCSRSAV